MISGTLKLRQNRIIAALVGLIALNPALASAQTALPAALQGKSWDQIVAAAKQEGTLHLYTGQVISVVERIVGGFRKAYPDIPIDYQRGPSGPMLTRLQQEHQAGTDGGDVWISTEVGWDRDQAKAGNMVPPVGPSAQAWPKQYILDGSVVIPALEPLTIYYNKTLVKDPPKSYADLLRPEFKNRIGSSDLASTVLIAWYDWLEKTQGPDYLPKLKAQNPKMYTGASPGSQAIASGEIAVNAFGNQTAATPLADQGAPIVSVVPSPGLGIQYAMVITGWGKHPNAAQVFADYVMSRDGQTAWHNRGETASPLPNIPGGLDVNTIKPWDPAAYPPDVVAKYTQHWNSIFK